MSTSRTPKGSSTLWLCQRTESQGASTDAGGKKSTGRLDAQVPVAQGCCAPACETHTRPEQKVAGQSCVPACRAKLLCQPQARRWGLQFASTHDARAVTTAGWLAAPIRSRVQHKRRRARLARPRLSAAAACVRPGRKSSRTLARHCLSKDRAIAPSLVARLGGRAAARLRAGHRVANSRMRLCQHSASQRTGRPGPRCGATAGTSAQTLPRRRADVPGAPLGQLAGAASCAQALTVRRERPSFTCACPSSHSRVAA